MSGEGKAILVVDDDTDIASNMSDILTDLGYQTAVAHDGKSAIALAKSSAFDVALLDFKMPDMDGAELYKQIKSLQPDMIAIMVTAYAGSGGTERAMSAGTWQVMRKPVDFSKLLAFIEEAVR